MSNRISFRAGDGWGWFSFVENNIFVIGESYPHEGGTLYRGEYKGDDTPYILSLKKDDPEQYNRIVEHFKDSNREMENKKMEQFKKEVRSVGIYLLYKCVSDEYAEKVWNLIEKEVYEDVWESSGYQEDGLFSDSDVKYAIGRILIESLEKEDTLYKLL